jgi:hypothetical protein
MSNGSAPLTGDQYQQLVEGLVEAFYTNGALEMMLQFRLGKGLNAIVPPGPLVNQAFYLVQAAEAEGWTRELVEAARKSRPRNAKLLAVGQSIGTPTNVPPTPVLERVIKETNQFHDIAKWREAMGLVETQVCRIRIPTNKGEIFGTGFLVGPDVVMTNHHVVESVIAGEENKQTKDGRSAKAAAVVCQFDYKKMAGYLNKGIEVGLAANWLIDSSPGSPIDDENEPKSGVPAPEQLDYALLRLARGIGSEPIKATGDKAEQQADPRGWIAVPQGAQSFTAGAPIFIVQHPDGDPLVFALDTNGVLGLNGNDTRVKYTTNTLGGSSGSPCFDQDWGLVALHHSGDPNFDPLTKPKYNEGIPMMAIRALLTARGKAAVLDTPLPQRS